MNDAPLDLKRIWKAFGFCLTILVSVLSSGPSVMAQTYSNPNYRSAPKKGDAVATPNYSGNASGNTPTYNPYTGESTNNQASAGGGSQFALNFGLPVAVGVAGQGLTTKFGVSAQLYMSPMLDDSLNNFLMVGYDSFRLRADSVATLHLINFGYGVEFQPTPGKTFNPMLGVLVGGSYAMIAVPDSFTFNGKAYFLAQLRPGLDINVDGFSIVFQAPISWIVGTSNMSYIGYSIGARFGI
jgi:hypothetical protein